MAVHVYTGARACAASGRHGAPSNSCASLTLAQHAERHILTPIGKLPCILCPCVIAESGGFGAHGRGGPRQLCCSSLCVAGDGSTCDESEWANADLTVFQIKQCACLNGTGATGTNCPIHGDTKCTACCGTFFLGPHTQTATLRGGCHRIGRTNPLDMALLSTEHNTCMLIICNYACRVATADCTAGAHAREGASNVQRPATQPCQVHGWTTEPP